MILQNPSAFSAFKNIASLLPSVQNKMTHNALIKLLLDQGRTFNKTQDVFFKNMLADLEKILYQKQIPFETLYRTDKQTVLDTDTFVFCNTKNKPTYFIVERTLSAYLLNTLLGQSSSDMRTISPLSEMEKQILSSFYQRWMNLLPQEKHKPLICTSINPSETPIKTSPFSFIFKTKEQTFSFQIIFSQPTDLTEQLSWQRRLKEHVNALEIPLTGTFTQNISLSDFLSLKKGDTISFATTTHNTGILLKTHQHTVLKGRLQKEKINNVLQIETEEA